MNSHKRNTVQFQGLSLMPVGMFFENFGAGKFACIKLVVFFTFWQQISLQLAVQLDWIPSNPKSKCYNEGKVLASVASDFLITVEMLAFAIAHAIVFSSNPYRFSYES